LENVILCRNRFRIAFINLFCVLPEDENRVASVKARGSLRSGREPREPTPGLRRYKER